MYKPQFRITPYLMQLVTEATELKIEIDTAAIQLAWIPQLQKENAVKLAHFSTAIEGNTLSLKDVESLSIGKDIKKDKNSMLEVLNHLNAMRWVWKKKKGHSITEKDLLYLHDLLTKGLLPSNQSGKYKKKPNRIIDSTGVTVFVPPLPDQVRPLCLQLLKWLETEGQKHHPIIVSAIAHHNLVSIHPFSDGNGRISRVFGLWILFTRGFDSHHLFSLDEFFEKDRGKYYQKIQQARDLDDDLTYWLEYVALGVVATLKITRDRIHFLQVKKSNRSFHLTVKQEAVLRMIRDLGFVGTNELQKKLNVTRARIAQIIKPMIVAGLILRVGQTRNTRYRLP